MPLGSEMAQGHISITQTLRKLPPISPCSVLQQSAVRFGEAEGGKGGIGADK